jgi:hypothetical protein
MASTITNCVDLSVNDVKFYAPKATQGGGKNVGMINKTTHTALHIRLPIMFTFGASDYEGNEKYSCSLQFPDPKDDAVDPIYAVCLEKLVEFEAALKRKVFEFAKDWLGKPMKSEDMVDMIWTPMLKYPKISKDSTEVDTTRPPTFNIKIPCFEGKWSSEIYDEDRNMLFPSESDPSATPLNFITRGTNMKAIVKCAGLWIVGGKMGVTWKLVQTVVRQQSTSLQGVCHIEMDESEKKVLKRKADLTKHQDPESQEQTSSSSSSAAVSTEVRDSDDEQEAEGEKEDPVDPEDVDEEPSTPSTAPTTSVTPTSSAAASATEPKAKKTKRDTKK